MEDSEIWLALIQPLLALLIAGLFLALTRVASMGRHYGCFVLAFTLFAVGNAMQIVQWPHAVFWNVALSGLAYCAAATCFVEGVARLGKRSIWRRVAAVMAVSWLARLWFVAGVDIIEVRVWLLQGSVALVMAMGVWAVRGMRRGTPAERFFFWVQVVFTLSFVPRTLLTLPHISTTDIGYDSSAYWLGVQLTFYLLGVIFTASLLLLTMSRMVIEAREASERDPLTKLYNRRGLVAHWENHAREPIFSLILLDVDHFKRINDLHGHPFGDEVLRTIARLLQQYLRPSDVLARVGGEEFAIYLPGVDLECAEQIAQRLREAVAQHPFADGMRCTCSFGLGTFSQGTPMEMAYRHVDKLLYRAKQHGRNQVQVMAPRFEVSSEHPLSSP